MTNHLQSGSAISHSRNFNRRYLRDVTGIW